MAGFGAGLRIVRGPNDALDGVTEDNVRDLIVGEKCAD